MDPSIEEKIQKFIKGEIDTESEEIVHDFHGLSLQQAKHYLDMLLSVYFSKYPNLKRIKFITGKVIHSSVDKPTLRDEILETCQNKYSMCANIDPNNSSVIIIYSCENIVEDKVSE